MANKSTVAGDLRRFATFVKGLTDAADTLDQMQSMEEMAKATEQRVAAADALLSERTVQIASADKQLAEIRDKASKSVKDAQQRAQVKYDEIVSAAERLAAQVHDGAQVEKQRIIGEAQVEHARLTEQITGMGEQLVRMAEDRDALAASIESGTATLADLENKLAAAREAVAKLLG